MPIYKRPESVLVLVHNDAFDILLLERKDYKGFWQSVTGSLELGELPIEAAHRELFEETGIRGEIRDWGRCVDYEIFEQWRHRYEPHTFLNKEHHFSIKVASNVPIVIEPKEHVRYQWFPWKKAASLVFSPSNRQIILDIANPLKG
jgi:dATP pyrophosphohydrolase